MTQSQTAAGETPQRAGSTLTFFAATFVLSWVLWAPLIVWLASRGRLGDPDSAGLEGLPIWVGGLWFAGSWGPSLVAFWLTVREGGRPALKRLLARALEWRVGGRWHLAAWLGPMVIGLAAVGLYAVGGGLPPVDAERWLLIPVALVLAVPFGPLGEEFGWRGYALPRLLENRSPLTASVFIGLMWTAWHLPLFWAPAGTTISGSPVTWAAVAGYTAEVVSLSILLTWLYRRTGGSLLIAIGAHAAWNAGMERFLFAPLPAAAQPVVATWASALLAAAAFAVVISWLRGGTPAVAPPDP